jgi:hypothetical protein
VVPFVGVGQVKTDRKEKTMRKRNVTLNAVLACALSAVAWNLALGQDAPPPPPGDEGGPPPEFDPGGPPGMQDDQGGPASAQSGQGASSSSPSGQTSAQSPGDFNPQKMQQTFLDQIKATLGATDDEWKVLRPLLEKVMKLSRETGAQGPMAFGPGGPGGPGGRGGPPDVAGQQPPSEVAKAAQALQNTLSKSDATTDEITAGLKALRDAREKVSLELAKAKAAVLELVTTRQEAQLVKMGILD